MFGWKPEAARTVWTLFLILLALYLLYLSASTLALFAFSLFLAELLRPAVTLLDRLTPGRVPRTVSIVAAYAIIVVAIVVIGGAVGSRVGSQAAEAASRLPEIMKADPVKNLPLPTWLDPYQREIEGTLRQQLKNLQDNAIPLAEATAVNIGARAGNLLSIILVPILAFLFLSDNGKSLETVVQLAPSARGQEVIREVLEDIETLLTSYMIALVGLASSTFGFSWIFYKAAGVPYAALLAGLGACLEVIPLVGPLLAAVLTVVFAATAGYNHPLWIIAFLGVFRVFQDYLLSPHLMGKGVKLHPMAVIFGVLAGEQIAGVMGMFFSIPTLAILRILFLAYRRSVIHRATDTFKDEPAEDKPLIVLES